MIKIDKTNWPADVKNYSVGNNGFMIFWFNGDAKPEIGDTSRDVTTNFTSSTIDTSSRRSGQWKEALPVFNELSLDAELLFEELDDDESTVEPVSYKLQQAAINRDIFRIGAFTEGGNGAWFWGCVTDCTRSEPLEDIVKVSAKFALTRYIGWYDTFETKIPGATDETGQHPYLLTDEGKADSGTT